MGHIQGFNPENPGGTFNMERLTPQFRRLCAGIGYFLKRTDQWCLWEPLLDQHGYERVCAALRRCEPNEQGFKSINITAKICATLKREADDAAKQAAQDAANAEMKEKARAKGRLVKVGDKWVVQEVTP